MHTVTYLVFFCPVDLKSAPSLSSISYVLIHDTPSAAHTSGNYQQGFRGVKMLTEEEPAAAYEEATDGCRLSALGDRDNARQSRRVKPDPETNPLADLDCEKMQTRDQPVPQVTPLRASTCA